MATVDRPTRAATRMSVATLASRGIGFVRVWAIAAVLGTTFLGNAYQSSSSVSNVLFELLAAGALSAVLVPTFVHLLDAGEDRDGGGSRVRSVGSRARGDGSGVRSRPDLHAADRAAALEPG